MIPTMFHKGALPFLERAVNFSFHRHKVIVNNIANVDTPRYQALDLPVGEFQGALKQALAAREKRPVRFATFDDASEVQFRPNGDVQAEFVPAETGILRHDENNVNPEYEMVRLVKNSGRHMALMQMLTHQLGLLEAAIRGRLGA